MRRLVAALALLLCTASLAEATCYLKVSTALATGVALGPFVDNVDGFTAETALTIAQADVRLKKGEAAWAQKGDATSCTHRENGWYDCPLSTTDTNTVGTLIIAVNETGALPVWKECIVLPANAYDGLIAGTGVGLRADVQGWLGTAPATPTVAGVPEVDVTHFNGTAGTFAAGRPEVNTSHVGGTLQTAGDVIGDTNDIQTRLPAALVTGRMDSSVGAMATGVLTATAIAADAITDAKVAADVTIASVTGAVGSVTGAVGSVTAAVTIANAQGFEKNVAASNYAFMMYDSTTGAPKPGATVSCAVAKDAEASFTATTNSPSERASGQYLITLTAAEMNATRTALRCTATGAKDTNVVFHTVLR